jgi:hypothetical protein
VFLTFMIMDINRNALRRNRDKAVQSKIDQLTRLWGDETWEAAALTAPATCSATLRRFPMSSSKPHGAIG